MHLLKVLLHTLQDAPDEIYIDTCLRTGPRRTYLLLSPKKTDLLSEKLAELDPTVFAHPIRRDILHLCVVHHLDSLRQGSASTKTRGEVAGSGRKIRPQKGSGRARLGERGNPMLRGGGVAFGPKPRDFSTKLPRKVIQMGMRVALSSKLGERQLGVVQSLAWPGSKTKHLAQRMDVLGWRKTLFVTGEEVIPSGLEMSSRSIKGVQTKLVQDLKVYDVIRWQRVVMDVHAIEYLERTLSKTQLGRSLPPPFRSPVLPKLKDIFRAKLIAQGDELLEDTQGRI